MDLFWLRNIVSIVATSENGDHPIGSAVEVCAGGQDQKSLTSPQGVLSWAKNKTIAAERQPICSSSTA